MMTRYAYVSTLPANRLCAYENICGTLCMLVQITPFHSCFSSTVFTVINTVGIYRGNRIRVKFNSELSVSTAINSEDHQGCPLSPTVFNIEYLNKRLHKWEIVELKGLQISIYLLYLFVVYLMTHFSSSKSI
jgi:hypothetical protein